jgi:hypothetical protein
MLNYIAPKVNIPLHILLKYLILTSASIWFCCASMQFIMQNRNIYEYVPTKYFTVCTVPNYNWKIGDRGIIDTVTLAHIYIR